MVQGKFHNLFIRNNYGVNTPPVETVYVVVPVVPTVTGVDETVYVAILKVQV